MPFMVQEPDLTRTAAALTTAYVAGSTLPTLGATKIAWTIQITTVSTLATITTMPQNGVLIGGTVIWSDTYTEAIAAGVSTTSAYSQVWDVSGASDGDVITFAADATTPYARLLIKGDAAVASSIATYGGIAG